MHTQFVPLPLAMISLTIGQDLRTSTTGSCAGTTYQTCLGSRWGDCCSTNGFCGQNATYCGAGCQAGFGACYKNANLISSDGSCGVNGTTCVGSIFGNCCSKTGFCGTSSSYCGVGCQDRFGLCGNAASNKTVSTVAGSASFSTSTTRGINSPALATTSPTLPSSTIQSSNTTMSPTAVPLRPVTSTAGFRAGMVVMAIVVAAMIGTLFLFFFVCRRDRSQGRATNETDCHWQQNQFAAKSELECTTASASISASDPGGPYIAELPARNSYKRGLVDERGTASYDGTYRGY